MNRGSLQMGARFGVDPILNLSLRIGGKSLRVVGPALQSCGPWA